MGYPSCRAQPGLILDIGNVLVTVSMEQMYQKVKELGFTDSVEGGCDLMKNIENLCNFGMISMAGGIDMNFGHMRGTTMPSTLYDKNKKTLIDYWCSEECVKTNDEILDFLIKLIKDKRLSVALASNLGTDHHRYILECHPFFKRSDITHVCSHIIGAVKPQYQFFNIFKKLVPWANPKKYKTSCVIYVDDKECNLNAGGEILGVKTFQFDSGKEKQKCFIDYMCGEFEGW